MSWFARSIASTLLVDDDDDDEDHEAAGAPSRNDPDHYEDHLVQGIEDLDLENRSRRNLEENISNYHDYDNDSDDPHGHGVKEDLTEFTETLARQLRGVASFLAPPPPPPPPPPLPSSIARESKSAVSENDLKEEESEDVEDLYDYVEDSFVDEDAVGVTDEALAFAQNIAHHPETWLDFPLSEEEEFEDFEISDVQYKHALAIERLVPRLAALRIEFCPAHMNEAYFWMVYFVLLHSRLNKHDADLLSTPQLVQARAMWMQELQKQIKPETDWFGRKTFSSHDSVDSPREDLDQYLPEVPHPRYWHHTTGDAEARPNDEITDFNTDKQPVEHDEVQFTNDSIKDTAGKIGKLSLAAPSSEVLHQDYDEDDDDDWLEETAELEGYSAAYIFVGNEEDVSFSDLEEDSDWTLPVKPKQF